MSIKKILKSTIVYVMLCISLLVSLFVFVLIPAISYQGDISGYYDTPYWAEVTPQGTLVVFMIIAAVIGEVNAVSSEKIYFLSKPIKRYIFLLAKCLSTITISFFIMLLCSFILIGITIFELISKNNFIFDHPGRIRGVNIFAVFGSYVAISLCSSIISTIWKYHLRGGICIILCGLLIAVYTILYPMLLTIYKGDFDDTHRFWWLLLPTMIYPVLTILIVPLGWTMFIKSEIES